MKPTEDRGEAFGWMRLASAPPTRLKLSQGTCDVWDGNEWTSQPTVSIVTAEERRKEDERSSSNTQHEATRVKGNKNNPLTLALHLSHSF